MTKKEHLRNDLEKITKCIHTVLQSFEFCYYLNYPKSDEELDKKHLEYISKSGFFSFSRYALWRVTILELHKLLNDNKETDKYNLHHLVRKLKNDGEYKSLRIEKDKVAEWENSLKKNDQFIKEVSSLRFKLYAHLDGDFRNVIDQSELTLKNTENLINLVVKIVFEIYLIVFDTHYQFEPIYKKKSVRKIIDDILNKREADRNEIIKNFIDNTKKKNSS